MFILNISTGIAYEIEIIPIEEADYKRLSKKKYYFDWKTEQEYEIYKLRILGRNEILGLISLERIPSEWRVHIRLLTVSKENKGSTKQYEHIAGSLIAFAASIAVRDYAEFACISLRPKIQIAQHYMDKYKMTPTGRMLSIEIPEIIDLINQYDHEN